jgi:DNA repair exonuclease SbcCD ATPase subunit
MDRASKEAALQFDSRILDEERGIVRLQRSLNADRETCAILTRPYKEELDALYAEMQTLQQERGRLFDERKVAYAALNDAKAAIDRWYAKSRRNLFGNGGRKLPKHALFGQSFGDLDGWKAERDAAGRRIQDLSRRIGSTGDAIPTAGEKIARLKAERQRMLELRRQGVRTDVLARALEAAEQALCEAQTRQARLASEKTAFVQTARHRMGVGSLEGEIERIEAARREFLDAFDCDGERLKRRTAHRVAWMQRHAG